MSKEVIEGLAELYSRFITVIFYGAMLMVCCASILIQVIFIPEILNIREGLLSNPNSISLPYVYGAMNWMARGFIFMFTFTIGMIPVILAMGLISTFVAMNNNLKDIKDILKSKNL